MNDKQPISSHYTSCACHMTAPEVCQSCQRTDRANPHALFKIPDFRGQFPTERIDAFVPPFHAYGWTPEHEAEIMRQVHDLKDRQARGEVPADEYDAKLTHLGSVGMAPGIFRPIGQKLSKAEYPALFAVQPPKDESDESSSQARIDKKDAERYRFERQRDYRDYLNHCKKMELDPISFKGYCEKYDAITDMAMQSTRLDQDVKNGK